jgi:LemA protein
MTTSKTSALLSVGIVAGVFFLLCVMLGSCVMGTYNGAIRARNDADAQWGNVENVMQRRADLVPNLVEVVKGSAAFEKSTLESVIQARAAATQVRITADDLSNPEKMKALQRAQGELSSALSRLMVTVEKYPDLKASHAFRDLQSQLEGTENRIAEERHRYNAAVLLLNNRVEQFPSSIGAGMAGVRRREPFHAEQDANIPPKVKF